MPRNRVLSFMSQWAQSPGSGSGATTPPKQSSNSYANGNGKPLLPLDTTAAQGAAQSVDPYAAHTPPPQSPATPSRARAESRGNRPLSMIQTYQPPQVDIANDTPPELQPIFTFLNSHGNKLYQEGYFLKLHDLDSRGRPSPDRTWVECFAQLVGTVLSLWDAAALDQAGVDGEVVPTFINLSDASLKMIESLPMSGAQGGKLQNVLSISTAANNRYLLHFSSLNSLTQWTAGIRLAMFEHATLQEAYTGSLIAGKGRLLNSIRPIMERARFPTEDWARVRFGAGTPWRRLWFVITPPEEKEYAKAQKMQKKGATFLRSELPKGNIKFYDTRKITKKTKPIATINDAYAAYAIYPQSKPLIEQSTLVKMEGLVTIHSAPETTAEGFVFVMPEVHPAVTGFEMMLRWLFPVWDTFNMYGRPTRLIADTLDQRGLMFAMPRDRRYGYLDTLDVSTLIHENGSQTWSERQWRKQLKKLTSDRMTTQLEGGIYRHHRNGTGSQSSLPNVARQGVRFDDDESIHSTPSRTASPAPLPGTALAMPKRNDTASPAQRGSPHKRSASDAQSYMKYQAETPSRLSQEMGRNQDYAPTPPRHATPQGPGSLQRIESGVATPTLSSLKAGLHPTTDPVDVPPEPITSPPAFTHNTSSKPANRPAVPPELRRAHSAVDAATLYQMQDAVRNPQSPDDEYGNLVTNMVHLPKRNFGKSDADDPFQGPFGNNTNLRTTARSRHEQNLSTIPASPLPDEPVSAIDQRILPVNTSHPLPLPPSEPEQRPPMPPPTRSSNSITRKPVVARKAVGSVASQQTASTPPSDHESFTHAYIDNDALEQVLSEDARLDSMGSIASSATPDYASTASGSSRAAPRISIEKPRMGQLKTVGNRAITPNEPAEAAIPTIDFGPTYSYKPDSRPTTANTITQADRSRPHSRDRLSSYLPNSNKTSPGEGNRQSYFGGTDVDQAGSRANVAWVPSTGANVTNGPALTPEQWVQYRAAMASQPQAAPRSSVPVLSHSRQNSATAVPRKLTKTPPPFHRNSSGDWSQHERGTPPSRPDSRGASSYFGRASPGGTQAVVPQTSLSAKEQTYVARATGTPLLDIPDGQRDTRESSPANLMTAVAMREREKAAVRDGMRGGQVQEAIRSRQQQQFQNNAEALRQQAVQNQQRAQQNAQAYQFQQNAYARSAMPQSISPSVNQGQQQSWISSQSYQQPMQPRQAYDAVNPGQVYDNGYSSPFAQRLYEGQQQQAYVAQQGQQQIPRKSPGQGYGRQ